MRVLFIHPRKDTLENPVPHLGLASLSAVLRQAGHEVRVLDEALYPADAVPPLAELITEFRPEIIGFSVYTATLDNTLERIAEARRLSPAPILAGGPHATLFPEQLVTSGLVDTVVRGEAEDVIVSLVEGARRRETAELVTAPMPDVTTLLPPDFTVFRDWQSIATYPLNTSRGCPFACSFCAVERITSRRWRARDPLACAAEVAAARARFPRLGELKVSDDCPTCQPEHFKVFLRALVAQPGPPLLLTVDNVRADKVDGELLALMKQAGAASVCLGVEHGHPEVFALVNKKETHEDIRTAARLVHEHGLDLGLCFIIGLPADSLARTWDSIRLARSLRPKYIFWNMMHPFPGTVAHQWFLDHGATVDPPRTYTSYDFHSLDCAEPAVETPEFSKWDRKRAYFLAVVETDQYALDRVALSKLLRGAWTYRLAGPVLRGLFRRVIFGGLRRLGRRLKRGTSTDYTGATP